MLMWNIAHSIPGKRVKSDIFYAYESTCTVDEKRRYLHGNVDQPDRIDLASVAQQMSMSDQSRALEDAVRSLSVSRGRRDVHQKNKIRHEHLSTASLELCLPWF